MTYVATTRPKALVFANGWRTQSGAVPNSATQVNDNSDTTYVTDTAANSGQISFRMDNPTGMPALAQLRQFRIRLRASQASGAGKISAWFIGVKQNPDGTETAWQSKTVSFVPTAAIATLSAAAESVQNGLHTFDAMGGPSLQIDAPLSADDHRVYEVYVDWTFNEAPVITGVRLSPVNANQLTDRPTAIWDYSDPEGDLQERYRVKVFTAAQYGAAGFDPETSAALWDSYEVFSSLASVVIGAPIPNGTTYKIYAKAADAGSLGRYGTWVASGAFTQNVLTASAPSVQTQTLTDAAGAPVPALTIQPLLNLLPHASNADFEDNSRGPTDTWSPDLNCSLTLDPLIPGGAASGAMGLAMAATAAGTMQAVSGTALTTAHLVPVSLAEYHARIRFKAAATARSVAVGIRWRDAAGAVISDSWGVAVNDAVGSWTEAVVTANRPANATYAAVLARVTAAAASEVHYVDMAALGVGSATGKAWSRGGLNNANHRVVVERSADGGTTWVIPYGGTLVPPTTGAPLPTYEDHTAPPGRTVTYRVRSLTNDGTYAQASPYTTTGPFVIPGSGWYLRDPSQPALNMALSVQSFRRASTEEQGRFYGMGRKFPMILRDVVQGERYTLVINLMSATAKAAFDALRDRQRALLLQTDMAGEQHWVSIDPEVSGDLLNSATRKTRPAHFMEIGLTEVEPVV